MSLSLLTVSFILTTYDDERNLLATIDSIWQQTCSDWKIIVFSHDFVRVIPWEVANIA